MLIAGAVVIIVIAIYISAWVQGEANTTFSQIITVGPVWNDPVWSCTSDENFIVHGAVRGLGNAQLTIRVSNLGAQSLYEFDPERIVSFSVGAEGGQTITLLREGTLSGWLTLQTMSNADAGCTSG